MQSARDIVEAALEELPHVIGEEGSYQRRARAYDLRTALINQGHTVVGHGMKFGLPAVWSVGDVFFADRDGITVWEGTP